MAQLFRDVGGTRSGRFPFRLSAEESRFLHRLARERGVHAAVIIRRALRLVHDNPQLLDYHGDRESARNIRVVVDKTDKE